MFEIYLREIYHMSLDMSLREVYQTYLTNRIIYNWFPVYLDQYYDVYVALTETELYLALACF